MVKLSFTYASSTRRLIHILSWRFKKHFYSVLNFALPNRGWLSKSAARYGAKLQAGFETPITPTMRRMFFAAGVGLVKTGSITTPARPLMSPVFQQIQDQIPGRIESKIADYLRRLGQNLRAA